MFATPQSVTYDGVARTLHKITEDKTSSVYVESGESELELKLSHQETKARTRHLVRLDRTVVAADPLTAINASQSAGAYMVIDEPLFGFSDDDLINQVTALTAWLSVAGNVQALLDGRH